VTDTESPNGDEKAEGVVGESRWPMAGAVLAAMVLTLLLPGDVRVLPTWLLPAVEAALLIALIVADPGAISRRSRWMRGLSIGLVSVLMWSALWATAVLIDQLITGGSITNKASDLLRAGAVVWLSTNIAFSLLYWELDGGGAAQRFHGQRKYPDFAFPQQLDPELAPPKWRPRYVDYLYLGFTNAQAFSPTDVMPLAPWAKLTMAVHSMISLAILGLVIARAVNVFA
jgi:uncharacterized membrane protein